MKATPQSAIPSAADASTIASVRSLKLSVVCTTRTTGAAAGTFDWDDKVSAPIADGAATPVVCARDAGDSQAGKAAGDRSSSHDRESLPVDLHGGPPWASAAGKSGPRRGSG